MNASILAKGDARPELSTQVKYLTPEKNQQWDDFVENCDAATFFHRAGWKTVIESAFGHRAYFLFAQRSGAIVGVLPLVHVKSLLFGSSLSSTPFCVYGGPASMDEEARVELEQAACDLARKLKVDALEMRNIRAQHEDWASKDLYVTFRKEIDPDPDVNLKAIPRKQRAMVKKGIKAGLASEETVLIERLYRVYSESVRNLGTPVFSKKYFQVLADVFGDACQIVMIKEGGNDIAGVMSFYFRDQVLPYYGGSLPIARQVKGNDFMYWDLMCRAAAEGVRVFDYGRSKKGTGSYSFKKNWGFTPEQLHYEYFLVKSDKLPDVNPMNPKYQYLIKAWRKLPLPIANAFGPMLAKDLG